MSTRLFTPTSVGGRHVANIGTIAYAGDAWDDRDGVQHRRERGQALRRPRLKNVRIRAEGKIMLGLSTVLVSCLLAPAGSAPQAPPAADVAKHATPAPRAWPEPIKVVPAPAPHVPIQRPTPAPPAPNAPP
ncbi:MAG: hypothetical protein AAF721_39305 [Myxococcota bacterium]